MIPLGVVASSYVPPAAGTTGVFQQATIDTASKSTYTFAAQPIGAAAADRRVIVAVGLRTTTLDSVTIGGIAATQDSSFTALGNIAAIWSAVVPTGTTADVVIATSGTQPTRCGIGVWTTNGDPTGSSAGYAGGSAATNPATLTVSTQAGDFVVATGMQNLSGASYIYGGAGTERWDINIESDIYYTGGDAFASSASTTITIDPAIDTASANFATAAAAYR